jgi:hypothetical protein
MVLDEKKLINVVKDLRECNVEQLIYVQGYLENVLKSKLELSQQEINLVMLRNQE